MVLADDNFATIVKAIRNGRNIYENIKKAILFLLSGNFAAILVVLFNSLLGLPVPFAAIHLLFINLLTDSLPAIGLGLEPHSEEVMKRKPRNANESILTRPFLGEIALYGVVIAIAVALAFLMGNKTSAALGMTMAFAVLCSARLFHGFSCKKKRSCYILKGIFQQQVRSYGVRSWNGIFKLRSARSTTQGTFQDSRHDRYAVCMDIHSKLWLYARYPAYKGDILYKV